LIENICLSSIQEAIAAMRSGRFVLVHDDKARENEIDMIIPAEHVTPRNIADMRNNAGGLICLAIPNEVATKLGLVYMHDILVGLSKVNQVFSKLSFGKSPYGDKPSFSIAVNHRDTYTGITDADRALTIFAMAKICKNIDYGGVEEFGRNFRAPGHVPILIASKGLIQERAGHTELCLYLARLAGLTPAVVICEMLDSITYKALSAEKAKSYAIKDGLPFVESSQLKKTPVRQA
jgi:3,4-dihydroxy 2-butanone 4-phosphate synthase